MEPMPLRRALCASLAVAALTAAWAPAAASAASGPPPGAVVEARSSRGPRADLGRIAWTALPPEGRETIARIRQGGPFPHRRDGVTFANREHRLPSRPFGFYREYTVPTPGARDRGARRIVAADDGALFYSPDHYRTFLRVEGSP
jgi:ribonuclease T1